jgi:hypothetical protein
MMRKQVEQQRVESVTILSLTQNLEMGKVKFTQIFSGILYDASALV